MSIVYANVPTMKRAALLVALVSVISGLVCLFSTEKQEKAANSALSLSVLPPAPSATSIPLATTSIPAAPKNLAKRLHELSQSMNELGVANRVDKEISEQILRLEPSDGKFLLQTALDQKKDKNERFLATFMMGKRAGEFMADLQKIAASNNSALVSNPEPHSLQHINKGFEISLRIEALKGLDSLANREGSELAKIFQVIRDNSQSQTIKKLASIAHAGATQNESILEKYIEAKLQAGMK